MLPPALGVIGFQPGAFISGCRKGPVGDGGGERDAHAEQGGLEHGKGGAFCWFQTGD
jgi:hypothetical protein